MIHQKFILFRALSGSMEIKIALLVYTLLIKVFLFFKFGHHFFVLFDFLGQRLDVLVDDVGLFELLPINLQM